MPAVSATRHTLLHAYLPLPAHAAGLRPSQIGLLSALRPWISAPCGSIVAALADRWGAHRFLLLFTYLAVTFLQARLLAGCRRGGLNLICYVALACCIQLLLVQSQAGPRAWMVPNPALLIPAACLIGMPRTWLLPPDPAGPDGTAAAVQFCADAGPHNPGLHCVRTLANHC